MSENHPEDCTCEECAIKEINAAEDGLESLAAEEAKAEEARIAEPVAERNEAQIGTAEKLEDAEEIKPTAKGSPKKLGKKGLSYAGRQEDQAKPQKVESCYQDSQTAKRKKAKKE